MKNPLVIYILLILAVLFVGILTVNKAEASTVGLENAYFLLNDYTGLQMLNDPYTIGISGCDVTGYTGNCITDGQNVAEAHFSDGPTGSEMLSEGWYWYALYANEHAGEGFPYTNQTTDTGGSGELPVASMTIHHEVSENLFLIQVDATDFTTALGMTSTDVLEEIGTYSSGCPNFCRAPVGFVFTTEDASVQLAAVSSYTEAYNFMVDRIGNINAPDNLQDTRISSLNSPEPGYNVVTASTTVEFDVDYVSATPVPEIVCFEINNLSVYQSLSPLCETVTQSGFLNFATSTVLIADNQYQWRVVIRGADTEIIDVSEWSFFTVLNSPQSPYDPGTSGNPYTGIPAGTSSTSTLSNLSLECDPDSPFFERSVCNLSVLLFVPSEGSIEQLRTNMGFLMSRQPFATFNDFRTAWNDATKRPDIIYTSLSLNLYGQDIDVVSTTSLASVAGEDSLDTVRYLMAVSLWIAFAWFCFMRISRFF